MSFMDKVKSGLTEAGSKAKVLVEVNRLKMQNSTKKKEIDESMQQIGNLIFLSSTGRRLEVTNEELQPIFDVILRLESERNDNLKQIKILSNEKECSCGKTVTLEVHFCSSCGKTFEEEATI